MSETTERSLSAIAREIQKDWGAKIYYGAVPYLEAMKQMDKISDQHGSDSGQSIVRYFIGNAATWRGPVAKRVKAELRQMAGMK